MHRACLVCGVWLVEFVAVGRLAAACALFVSFWRFSRVGVVGLVVGVVERWYVGGVGRLFVFLALVLALRLAVIYLLGRIAIVFRLVELVLAGVLVRFALRVHWLVLEVVFGAVGGVVEALGLFEILDFRFLPFVLYVLIGLELTWGADGGAILLRSFLFGW
uniref:Uncharacterized protein n=1 Tax=Anopheles darlingi TaxID=43151 RepID=A0A2M4D451_ANODA